MFKGAVTNHHWDWLWKTNDPNSNGPALHICCTHHALGFGTCQCSTVLDYTAIYWRNRWRKKPPLNIFPYFPSSFFFFFFRKYSAITALDQRQQYKDDFCAEYDEYRALHDRIGAITEMFVQLGSKINTLSPGTQEYKVLSAAGGAAAAVKTVKTDLTRGSRTRFLFCFPFQLMEDQILQKYRKYRKVRDLKF